jgi:hypothetical protein
MDDEGAGATSIQRWVVVGAASSRRDRMEVSGAGEVLQSVEQIVAKLRDAEKLQAQGATIAQVCKRLGISDRTFFRWRVGPGHEPGVGEGRPGNGKRGNGPAAHANHVWSYGFTAPRTCRSGPIRILNVVEYTRLALPCHVDRSIGARDLSADLERLFDRHGKPKALRSDNGEFIVGLLLAWLAERVETAHRGGLAAAGRTVDRFDCTNA